ncbi:hypothetical protein YDYSY3_55940 [Paenibacillus chitinolyticus]|nr:hypothetical protein YDYSY3_55940 [Paenibacillus chitinolyticus]
MIDVLIYNVGVWEKEGFSEHYDFELDDPIETDGHTFILINFCLPASVKSQVNGIRKESTNVHPDKRQVEALLPALKSFRL